MIKPPRLLRDEQKKLLNEYFTQYPDDERECYSVDEERLENARMKKWLYQHASELLQRYWDYRDWIGDEGQLCDGEGNNLYANGDSQLIQDWDVNDEGYCVFPGTDTFILNMNGKPIKNPVLDSRVQELYLSERVIYVADMAAMVVKQFPEQMDKIEESTDLDNKLLGHVFAAYAISQPMEKLFYSDKEKFRKYCDLIEELWRYGDDEVQNIIDVTILEDLNTGDLEVWKGLGDYFSEDFKQYINNELIHTNIVMRIVPI